MMFAQLRTKNLSLSRTNRWYRRNYPLSVFDLTQGDARNDRTFIFQRKVAGGQKVRKVIISEM